jgi:hypothetical protein
LAYALQDGPPHTADAVPEPNSNRIVWREGAQGTFSAVYGAFEYKYLRYHGKIVDANSRSYGSGLMAVIDVMNENDSAVVVNLKTDISIQMPLFHSYLLPLETEQLVKLLQKGSKYNKEIAKNIQKNPWTLSPVTINGKTHWGQIFYFYPDGYQVANSILVYEQQSTPFSIQVYVDGVAFVFPFKTAAD